jgi:hypothetical protein
MVNFYEQKRKMYEIIELTLKKVGDDGITLAQLIYGITSQLGVSELAIKKRVTLLLELGKAKEEGDLIKWKEI